MAPAETGQVYAEMKILITGAGGMLGSDLACELQPRFATVGMDRRPVDHLPIYCHVGDLVERAAVEEVVGKERPNLIFHAAAMTDVDGCQLRRDEAMEGNVTVTQNVVDQANRAGATVIFFSTDYVFDGTKAGEYEESDVPHPLSIYGESKYLAEQYIQRHAKRYVILRTSWLYGYWGKSFPRTILERAPKTPVFSVVSDQIGRPTYTKDMARGLVSLLARQEKIFEEVSGEIFNFAGGGRGVSWADFARGILKAAGYDQVEVREISSDQLDRPAPRPRNSVFALKKIESRLGLQLRSWDEAIPEFIEEVQAKER